MFNFIVLLGVWRLNLTNYRAWVHLKSTWNYIYPFYCSISNETERSAPRRRRRSDGHRSSGVQHEKVFNSIIFKTKSTIIAMFMPAFVISCDKSSSWLGHGNKNGEAIRMMAHLKTAPVSSWQRLDSCNRTDGDASDSSRKATAGRRLKDCKISRRNSLLWTRREVKHQWS